MATVPSVKPAEIASLIGLHHADPHAVLGPHVEADGLHVRACFPDAERVTVLPDDGEPVAMVPCGGPGFFEAVFPGVTAAFPYRLEIGYAHGDSVTIRDAYAFPPTLGDVDLHLFNEGRHERIYEKLGAHRRTISGVTGTAFAVWAPDVTSVSVVGNFNSWDGRLHPMRCLGKSGVWELFIPDLQPGALYKYELRTPTGRRLLRADPYGKQTEMPPGTASRIYEPAQPFRDGQWLQKRKEATWAEKPVAIYEVHLGSWRRLVEESNRPMQYREIAQQLADYVIEMGFTHVELLPVMEHPFGGSWGYQVSGYFSPSARFGNPDDFRFLIDHLHERGIGVILDWVPAHFPRDEGAALARFTGYPLYEHGDSRRGEHPDWGTYIFDYGRKEVKNFLVANALHWIDTYHLDGLRVDAVASMLYLDYSRKDGNWLPNKYGGRENLDAIALLQEVNSLVRDQRPGVMMIAEESTAYPGVTHGTDKGGLGFHFKWNMGWMNDTLEYFKKDPLYRRWLHNKLTFGMMYAYSETFVLPLSHDEVVHLKGSLLTKMPGDRWQKFANLRALYGYMWAFPGKKLLFMGGEFGQWGEWNHDTSLDWHLLWHNDHKGLQQLVKDLNHLYQRDSALWFDADPKGFEWINPDSYDANVVTFIRHDPATGRRLVCVGNFSPVLRHDYRVGLPVPGTYVEVLNTDATVYGGTNAGNNGQVVAEEVAWDRQPYSALLTLPPLAMVYFEAPIVLPEIEEEAVVAETPAPAATPAPKAVEPAKATAAPVRETAKPAPAVDQPKVDLPPAQAETPAPTPPAAAAPKPATGKAGKAGKPHGKKGKGKR
jgi:1,4-alpha-glucan branching enzyme